MADLEGKNIGKYRLLERLGRGGMAEVHKGYQAGLDRYVAIKVLHSYLADESDFIGRFKREARAVATLRHPNIVQVFDFDVEQDLYYMVMEFIDGPTLKTRLQDLKEKGERFSSEEIISIFKGLGSAIDYAHQRGMVHRDIKPANIMFNQDNDVVLTDFGVAYIVGGVRYTMTGAVSGTPAYMSPEQGMGQGGDHRSDIYSLGVILYEIFTGRVPFDADTPFAIIMKHLNEPLTLPSELVSIPGNVERVILKAMSKDPDDRYQTGKEMSKALESALLTSSATITDQQIPKATTLPGKSESHPIAPDGPASARKSADLDKTKAQTVITKAGSFWENKSWRWALIAIPVFCLIVGFVCVLLGILDDEDKRKTPTPSATILALDQATASATATAHAPTSIIPPSATKRPTEIMVVAATWTPVQSAEATATPVRPAATATDTAIPTVRETPATTKEPAPSPLPTHSPTPAQQAGGDMTAEPTVEPTKRPIAPSPTLTRMVSGGELPTNEVDLTATQQASQAIALAAFATQTAEALPTETFTIAPTDTPIPADTPTATPTDTPIPTDTPTATPTDTPIPTDTPTATPTDTPIPTDTPTATPTDTPIPTDTPTATPTDTSTPTDTPTATPTDTSTPTDTPTATPTNTSTPTDTPTATPTDTSTPDWVATDEARRQWIATAIAATQQAQQTVAVATLQAQKSEQSLMATAIAATLTAQPTPTDTATPVPTDTPTPTDTPMPTDTPTPTDTPIPTDTPTPTGTPIPMDTLLPALTPTATASILVLPTSTSMAPKIDCKDDAIYQADVTIPDGTQFEPGSSFDKTWRLKNVGTCPWTGYHLQFFGGSEMATANRQPVPDTAPGQSVDITVPMIAPTSPGEYSSLWEMANDRGETFGQRVSVKIQAVPKDLARPTQEIPEIAAGTTVEPEETAEVATPAPIADASSLAGHIVYPEFIPGGSKPHYDLYVSKLDGTDKLLLWEWGRQPKLLKTDQRETQRIVFQASGPQNNGVWRINIDRNDPRQLTMLGDDTNYPYGSPGGNRVLFASRHQPEANGERVPTIWIQDNVDKVSDPLAVMVANRSLLGNYPVWMENDWVVYQGCQYWGNPGKCGLHTVPSWGGDSRSGRQITDYPRDLSVDAVGETIVYISDKGGNWDIYTINFNGGGETNLTQNPTNDGLPTFSPDGSQIAFVSDRDGQWAIWVMGRDGSNPFKCFNLRGNLGEEWNRERITWTP